MAKIAPFGRYRALDNDGAPLAGGKLYTYEAGTSTPKTTYTTKAATSANTNPVIMDANGYADVWLDTGGYKFILKDSSDNTIWTADNLDGGNASGYASTVITKSSGFALSTNEQNNVIVCTASLTVSLLPAATAGDGFTALLINTSSGNITIDPDGSETINGSSTLTINPNSSLSIHTNGTNWYATNANVGSGAVNTTQLAFGLTGVIAPYAGSSAPTGWLMCYGQAVSRATYATLFALIGTTYGTGDGSTTFNMPDLRGRSVFGVDNMGGSTASRVTSGVSGITGTALGAVGGSEAMHQHTHTATVNDSGHSHGYHQTVTAAGAGGGADGVFRSGGVSQSTQSATTGITVTNANSGTGSSQNMPPAIMLNYIIKT